jgi:hypothetical protein
LLGYGQHPYIAGGKSTLAPPWQLLEYGEIPNGENKKSVYTIICGILAMHQLLFIKPQHNIFLFGHDNVM